MPDLLSPFKKIHKKTEHNKIKVIVELKKREK